ncbi:hypothetical protein LTR37_013299 [Vermiconidia calcicola]|uniref:Uncharacterized protein n=1 Tax=Vermiconidia calcicola TaxID=1690605 RepID=A0ACC3MY36_9PEZI|nr:hypothetical protein LTR37_013299 [Vermiconidia calcicola]
MSAPNEGRQSPDPENQTNRQQASTAGNPNEQGQASSNEAPADDSTSTLKGLESNPKHALQDAADAKTAKGTSSDK